MGNILSAWITVNRACNLHCEWCYAKVAMKKSDMNISLLKQLVDISADVGIADFKLIGGEPTIYPHFFDVIEYLMDRQANIVVVSNGIRLSDFDFCNRLAKYHYPKLHFGISLKGASEEDYLRDCGAIGFSKVLAGLKNCDDFGLSYSLSYVLTSRNIKKLTTFAQSILAHGIRKRILMSYCNDAISDIDHPCELQLKMDYMFAEQYDSVSELLNYNISLYQIFPLCMCEAVTFQKMLSKHQIITTCHVHKRNGVIFDTDGSILLCNHLAGYGIGKFGIDFTDASSFRSFWNSEYAVNLHKKFTMLPSCDCKDCSYLSQCGGGCLVQWFTQHFDEYKNFVDQRAKSQRSES